MKKAPESPEAIFKDYVADWQTSFGHEVEGIYLYGSAARGEYVAGKSDINFLVLLTPFGMARLRHAVEITEKWRKRNVAVPLVLTRDYIMKSLDSFPIEFLTIKRHYRVIFGQDVLANLEISEHNLRLELERELKSKLLHLREGLLSMGDATRPLRELLERTIPTFAALFEAFLHLQREKAPATKRALFDEVVRVAGLDGRFVDKLFGLHEEGNKLYREELWDLMEEYILQIEKLTQYVDRMVIPENSGQGGI